MNIILKRKSRSVCSYTDDESLCDCKNSSISLINVSSETNARDINKIAEVDPKEFLEKWLDNGPALVTSEQHLYPDEILGVEDNTSSGSTSVPEKQLTLRTDALLNTTSFNLVKPKL